MKCHCKERSSRRHLRMHAVQVSNLTRMGDCFAEFTLSVSKCLP
jgi:hypothetical protein